ncbi:hypothetical protein VNO77_36207 [Canavalia gladiata]|uniref:Peroxin-13 n=1 Tax=Canavalia gladiata TaxID=3824 RepID=A0AAN9PW41_CANGL
MAVKISVGSISLITDVVEVGVDKGEAGDEHNHSTSSSMTDSSHGSGSMMHVSSSGSQSFENQKHSKVVSNYMKKLQQGSNYKMGHSSSDFTCWKWKAALKKDRCNEKSTKTRVKRRGRGQEEGKQCNRTINRVPLKSLCCLFSIPMDTKPQPSASANGPPPKPWERAASSSGPAPFKPPSAGSTSDVVEASGTAKPGEIVPTSDISATINRNTLGRPLPTRPWEQNYGNTSYGGYGSTMNYNSGYGYGSGMYGSYGGVGGLYGGGMYGNNMYRGGYGGLYGSSGMYGGGMYNGGGFGGTMGGYGLGGGPYGDQDPNNPYGAPPSPPGFWISFLRVMQGVVNFFGRISILIDQNTQAFHMFMTALLQLFDRSGLLYGELARFVLRLLGIRTKPKKINPPSPNGLPLPAPHNSSVNEDYIGGTKAAPSGSWDNVWENDASK